MTDKAFPSTPFHRNEMGNLEINVNSKPFHWKDGEHSTGMEKLVQELKCEGKGSPSIHTRSTGMRKTIPPESADLSTGMNGLERYIYRVKVIIRKRKGKEYIERRVYLPGFFDVDRVLILPLDLALKLLRKNSPIPPGRSKDLAVTLSDLTLNLDEDAEARLRKIIDAYSLDLRGLVKLAIETLARDYNICPRCHSLVYRIRGVHGNLFYCRRCGRTIIEARGFL